MSFVPLVIFAVFSSLWANLLLQCGLGIKSAVVSKGTSRGNTSREDTKIQTTLIKLGIIFAAVLLLWLIFDRILFFLSLDLLLYVLVFPAGVMAYDGLEFLFYHFVLKKEAAKNSHINFCNGITAVILFVCLNLANNIFEAAVFAFGFVFGIILSVMIIREIRRRSALEAVPVFLRGNPLLLISMGLISMVFYAVSLMFFGILGG